MIHTDIDLGDIAFSASTTLGYLANGDNTGVLPTDTMTAVFTDTRVRQRELQVTARLRAGDQLEIIKVQSVKEGKLYDILYYCEVCSITAYTPGLCPCCRNELEFREKPQ